MWYTKYCWNFHLRCVTRGLIFSLKETLNQYICKHKLLCFWQSLWIEIIITKQVSNSSTNILKLLFVNNNFPLNYLSLEIEVHKHRNIYRSVSNVCQIEARFKKLHHVKHYTDISKLNSSKENFTYWSIWVKDKYYRLAFQNCLSTHIFYTYILTHAPTGL